MLSAPDSSPITQLAASFGWPPSAPHHGLVVRGELAAGGEHAGVVVGEAVLAHEARGLLVRQLGQRRAHRLDGRVVDHERQQVRVGEVAVVVRLFLGAHRARLVLVRIVQARFLHDLAAALEQLDLALDLVVDRVLDEAERVEVLDLGARAELRPARPGARTRWRRSGTSLPACCRRRSRGSAPACGSSSGRRPPPSPSAGRARRRSRAAACRRGSGRCRRGRGSPRAATCRRPPRGARG